MISMTKKDLWKMTELLVKNKQVLSDTTAAKAEKWKAANELHYCLQVCLDTEQLNPLTACYQNRPAKNLLGYETPAVVEFITKMIAYYPPPVFRFDLKNKVHQSALLQVCLDRVNGKKPPIYGVDIFEIAPEGPNEQQWIINVGNYTMAKTVQETIGGETASWTELTVPESFYEEMSSIVNDLPELFNEIAKQVHSPKELNRLVHSTKETLTDLATSAETSLDDLSKYAALVKRMDDFVANIENEASSKFDKLEAAAKLKKQLNACLLDTNLDPYTAVYKNRPAKNVFGYEVDAVTDFLHEMHEAFPASEESSSDSFDGENANHRTVLTNLLEDMIAGRKEILPMCSITVYDRPLYKETVVRILDTPIYTKKTGTLHLHGQQETGWQVSFDELTKLVKQAPAVEQMVLQEWKEQEENPVENETKMTKLFEQFAEKKAALAEINEQLDTLKKAESKAEPEQPTFYKYLGELKTYPYWKLTQEMKALVQQLRSDSTETYVKVSALYALRDKLITCLLDEKLTPYTTYYKYDGTYDSLGFNWIAINRFLDEMERAFPKPEALETVRFPLSNDTFDALVQIAIDIQAKRRPQIPGMIIVPVIGKPELSEIRLSGVPVLRYQTDEIWYYRQWLAELNAIEAVIYTLPELTDEIAARLTLQNLQGDFSL